MERVSFAACGETSDVQLASTTTGHGPFVSGLSAAAKAAVGLRHRPAGLVFSARRKENGGWIPSLAPAGAKHLRQALLKKWGAESPWRYSSRAMRNA